MDLKNIIRKRATVDGTFVRVDHFLNHTVDPVIMTAIGADIAVRTAELDYDVILTAEASGIAPALATAAATAKPMIYARKTVGAPMDAAWAREVDSPSKGRTYLLNIKHKALAEGTRVLIVDDFLSTGSSAIALGEMVEEAGAEVVRQVFVIEKAFNSGRDELARRGWETDAIATVVDVVEGHIVLAEGP